MAFCKPRRVVSEKEKKKQNLPTPYSWNLASEIKRMHYYNLSLPVCGICYGSPGKLI